MRQIVHGQNVSDWVAKHQRRGEGYGPSMGIGMLRDGELIAGCVFNEWNGVNINMHVAAIGKDWMTKAYLWTCFYFPFEQLKVKRITGFVEDDNEQALRFDKHLGFKYETKISQAYEHDGKIGDIIVLCMRREDCRWLNLRVPEKMRLAA